MKTEPLNIPKDASFTGTDAPTLAVRFLDGRRVGWPLSTLASWEFKPSIFVTDSVPESGRLQNVQELSLIVGYFPSKRKLVVHGLALDRVVDVLDLGNGGVLVERGERYRALAKPDEPYIDSIAVEEVEEAPRAQSGGDTGDDDDGGTADGLKPPED
jgi:hypothetical protein